MDLQLSSTAPLRTPSRQVDNSTVHLAPPLRLDPPLSADTADAADTADTAQASARARALFDAHYDFVWRSLRGLGVQPGSLDDGAQQVFLLAFRKLDVIGEGSERPFLFRLATGIAANLRRTVRRKREVADDAVLDLQLDARPDPEELASRGEAQRVLEEALSWMPGELRMVFVLFELEEMEIPDIAASLEIPVGTVGSRLRRAREKFKEAVTRLRRTESTEGRHR